MSKIEELIQRLCPDGVEYKPLEDVCSFYNGFAFKSSLFKERGFKIVRITNIDGRGIDMSDIKFFDAKDYKANLKTYEINRGDILIAMSGATTGKIGYYDQTETLYLNQRVGKILSKRELLDQKYLYHFLLTQSTNIYLSAGGGAQPNLSSQKFLKEFTIPVPPIEVQQEIVRILDKFTAISEKLNAELDLRKKQYEYYCEFLITREKGTEKRLKDILLIKNGRDYKHLKEGDIPVYGSGGVMTYVNESTYDKPSVLIPRKGSLDKLYYIDTPFWNVDTVFYTEIKTDIIVPKYLYYSLRLQHLEKLNNAGGVPSLTQSVLKNVCVLVPPISEQERIVSILDKFEALLYDKEKGLPAEIRKVQQQYEYYRDKLLTF